MKEGAKEERVEKAAAEANGPDEEVENKKEEGAEKAKEEEEQVGKKRSDEREKKAEGAGKQNEAKEKTGPTAAQEEVGEKDTGSPKSQTVEKKPKEAKEQKDKEPAKKIPISSFFGEEEFALEMCLNCLLSVGEYSTIFSVINPSSHLSFLPFLIFIFPAAPRKAAVKSDKTETKEGERKTDKKNSGDECKDKKG